uniref:ribosomal protein S6 kinase delta-1-like isoform X2 n=1 Tax=Myxine glutinosa TaxID=7769 RepID=UPI00358E953F
MFEEWVSEDFARFYTVSDTRRHERGHTEYKITAHIVSRSDFENVTELVIWKRCRDVKRLHKALFTISNQLRNDLMIFPPFSKTRSFGRFDEHVIEERRQQAEDLLQYSVTVPKLHNSSELKDFFKGCVKRDPALQAKRRAREKLSLPLEKVSLDVPVPIRLSPTPSLAHEVDSLGGLIEQPLIPLENGLCIPKENGAEQSEVSCVCDASSRTSTLSFTEPPTSLYNRPATKLKCKGMVGHHVVCSVQSCEEPDLPVSFHSGGMGSAGGVTGSGGPFTRAAAYFEQVRSTIGRGGWSWVEGTNEPRGNGDRCSSPDGGYLVRAARQIQQALEKEQQADYEGAFGHYQNGVEVLLQGVQADPDPGRRDAVKRKTRQYLTRAEDLFTKHLDSPKAQTGVSSLRLRPVRGLSDSADKLSTYKMKAALGKVMLVMDPVTSETYILKGLRKSSAMRNAVQTVLPQAVPNMVRLERYFTTDYSIFLLLQHVSGGKLWSRLKARLVSKKDCMENICQEATEDNLPITGSDKEVSNPHESPVAAENRICKNSGPVRGWTSDTEENANDKAKIGNETALGMKERTKISDLTLVQHTGVQSIELVDLAEHSGTKTPKACHEGWNGNASGPCNAIGIPFDTTLGKHFPCVCLPEHDQTNVSGTKLTAYDKQEFNPKITSEFMEQIPVNNSNPDSIRKHCYKGLIAADSSSSTACSVDVADAQPINSCGDLTLARSWDVSIAKVSAAGEVDGIVVKNSLRFRSPLRASALNLKASPDHRKCAGQPYTITVNPFDALGEGNGMDFIGADSSTEVADRVSKEGKNATIYKNTQGILTRDEAIWPIKQTISNMALVDLNKNGNPATSSPNFFPPKHATLHEVMNGLQTNRFLEIAGEGLTLGVSAAPLAEAEADATCLDDSDGSSDSSSISSQFSSESTTVTGLSKGVNVADAGDDFNPEISIRCFRKNDHTDSCCSYVKMNRGFEEAGSSGVPSLAGVPIGQLCHSDVAEMHRTIAEESWQEQVVTWSCQLVDSLESLHQQGIVCGDLNPSNLLLDDNGRLCLTYFGQWSEVEWTCNQHAVKDMHCAPEVVRGEITEASDWWSLGAIIYELLTGEPLRCCHPNGFGAKSRLSFPEHLPTEAKSLLQQLLQYDPTNRLGVRAKGVDTIRSHPFFCPSNPNGHSSEP